MTLTICIEYYIARLSISAKILSYWHCCECLYRNGHVSVYYLMIKVSKFDSVTKYQNTKLLHKSDEPDLT